MGSCRVAFGDAGIERQRGVPFSTGQPHVGIWWSLADSKSSARLEGILFCRYLPSP